MVHNISLPLVLIILIYTFGCIQNPLNEDSHDHEVDTGEISPGKLFKELSQGENIFLIDTRNENDFKAGHIEGAINLPLEKISHESVKKHDLTGNAHIIVYHKSSSGGKKAQSILSSLDFDEVLYINGGITHWEEDGHALSGGQELTLQGSSGSDVGGPRITFDRDVHDFGKVLQFGGIVSTEFKVMNSGVETLKLGDITTSCGCTTANISVKTIQPGKETILTVYFNPNLHEEPKDIFSRTVFIESNDLRFPETEIKIKVDIIEGE